MTHLTLFETWHNWRSGHLDPELVLWGIRLLWWARVGKILQIIGAVTVLVDIIGPRKLRRMGKRLKELSAVQKLKDNQGAIFKRLMEAWHAMRPGSTAGRKEILWQEILADPLLTLNALLTVAAALAAWHFSPFPSVAAKFILAVVAILFADWLLVYVLVATFNLVAVPVAVVLVELPASLLSRKNLVWWIRLFAGFLLFVGFHFDLLTS
jgi:hypothetical protein